MSTSQVYIPVIYGKTGDDNFCDVVGVYLTQKEAVQSLCDKLCDNENLFPYHEDREEFFGEVRVKCTCKKTLETLCKTEGDSWYNQNWFWKISEFPRTPLDSI